MSSLNCILMSKNQPIDDVLRVEVAAKFKQAITDNRLSYSQAAKLLGIHRQTLWLYLNRKATPGGEVLRRACHSWGITLSVNGFQFSEEAFAIPKKQILQQLPQQLELLDALQALQDDQIEVKIIGKVGDAFEVKLRIRGTGGTFRPGRRRAS
jgi:transcriptional regulator with XRE-family HTH domain